MDAHGHGHGAHDTTSQQDKAAGHGMLVVGTGAMFFSHLPMFMSPHDYQVILEGTLAGADPQRIYRDDRKAHPETVIYTFNPTAFVLPDLFPPAPKRVKFRGDLVREHFESPPEFPKEPHTIARGVDVNVTNVVYFQKLNPDESVADTLEYLLFGKGEELFLAHVITGAPDFDHIVSASVTGRQFTDDELRAGIRVQFPGTANRPAQRLRQGKTVSGTTHIADKKIEIKVEPRVDIYLMERELAKPEPV